ncbi:hypothetical protein SDC9_178761 [bioreactor metagenome]|uniref:Uncharacterized protein n=1 Tax=bioreactor metagenome TaxID=1076179 RepID=A0A645GX49_9ZZZZ
MAGKICLDAGGEDFAARLLVQILVAPDMVGVGVGVENGLQPPAVFVQHLAHLAPGLLVVSAVYEVDLALPLPINADFRRAVDVIASLPNLHQFVHHSSPLFLSGCLPSL